MASRFFLKSPSDARLKPTEAALSFAHVLTLACFIFTTKGNARGETTSPESKATQVEPMGKEISLDDSPSDPATSSDPGGNTTPRKKLKSLKNSPKNPTPKKSSSTDLEPESPRQELEKNGAETPFGEGADDENTMWESYKDGGLAGSMDEVTDRVKIQDIVEPPSVYHYAAFGKPDPFRPISRAPVTVTAESNDVEVPIVSALQTKSIETMTILGIWQGGDGLKKAMISFSGESPPYDGGDKGYVIKIGDPIGNRGGVVQGINPDGVTVREFEVLADGTRHFTDITIPFQLQITTPQPPFGSWIFKPGMPRPEYKSPTNNDQNSKQSGTGGIGAPNGLFTLPQSMLGTLNKDKELEITETPRFTTPAKNQNQGTPNGSRGVGQAGASNQAVPPQMIQAGTQGGFNLNTGMQGTPTINQNIPQVSTNGISISQPPNTSSQNNTGASVPEAFTNGSTNNSGMPSGIFPPSGSSANLPPTNQNSGNNMAYPTQAPTTLPPPPL